MLEARNISKSFGGIRVLKSIAFDLQPGEVHALVGENGAGKSTLVNILSGALRPDSGELLWDGRPMQLRDPRHARALGISSVHQELALVPQLSVAENVFLGRHPVARGLVNFGEMHGRTRRVLAELGREIDPRRLVAELSLADRQIVEIARAVAFESRLIVMDEPTAPLSEHDAQALFRSIRLLRARGVALIYISHRLREIFEISDRVTVLRDGSHVFTRPTSEVTQEELVRAMIGTELKERLESRAASRAQSEEALRIEGPVRLTVHRGEIVGLAGLAGAGSTELLEGLFGAHGRASAEVLVDGRRVRLRHPADAIRSGIALVPDDRKAKGLVLGASVQHNIALAAGRKRFLVRRSLEERAARHWITALRIRAAGPGQPVVYLSGGNQQKVVLAKWLFAGARVFLLDEPTRGIDVGAKAEIYDRIRMLAGEGAAVLMASSELEELLALADRIVVMHRGSIAGELTREEATEEKIMHLATGGVD
ncbi:MAG TPA: sugar ABC transporter ATP-binding protein [Candidatus Acidoferrales bacterium]|nr:sugar ABC transporter ATP-binding protein [Candidatus Acidoferrales bacterium]HXK00808.1 sugar ABC transporter ATP-binding protein [Verrucomicrobiae bacterium]